MAAAAGGALTEGLSLSFAAQVEHVSFRTPHSKLNVRGALMRHAYWTVRTGRGERSRAEQAAEAQRALGVTFGARRRQNRAR